MKVEKLWATPDAERMIARCARVSAEDPDKAEYEKLLSYMIRHGHWSPFDMSCLCVEVTTSRAIAHQFIRHTSQRFPEEFHYQEFSQRYAEVVDFEPVTPRRQDTKNRQNSIDDLSPEDKAFFAEGAANIERITFDFYQQCLKRTIAKETARMYLPESVQTKFNTVASCRSWIHYLKARLDPSTQAEHREVAEAIVPIFKQEFPTVFTAMGWV
jgi:thymidylate synthase (FAD)